MVNLKTYMSFKVYSRVVYFMSCITCHFRHHCFQSKKCFILSEVLFYVLLQDIIALGGFRQPVQCKNNKKIILK